MKHLQKPSGKLGIKRAAKDIVVEMVARDPFTEEAFNRDIIEEIREEIETTFDKTKTVQNHRFDNIRMTEMVTAGFGDGRIDNIGDMKRIVGTSNNAEVADRKD